MIGDRVVIPAEAGVEGKVVDVQSAGRFSGRPKVAVQMTRLTYNGNTYELRSSQYSKQGASRDARTVAAIGGGAGVGAIIGAVLGGGRGAAIGSVIGAGVGTGAQATGKAPQVNLPAETVLSFRLQSPLTVIPSTSTLQRGQATGPGFHKTPSLIRRSAGLSASRQSAAGAGCSRRNPASDNKWQIDTDNPEEQAVKRIWLRGSDYRLASPLARQRRASAGMIAPPMLARFASGSGGRSLGD
jgi:outer membrane lipoprotein SlyB